MNTETFMLLMESMEGKTIRSVREDFDGSVIVVFIDSSATIIDRDKFNTGDCN